jgi:hypothetical protein
VPTEWFERDLILAVATTVGGAFNVVFGSIRQRIVPNHLLGRVMASFRVISWGSIPLGALLGGIIGQVEAQASLNADASMTVSGSQGAPVRAQPNVKQ